MDYTYSLTHVLNFLYLTQENDVYFKGSAQYNIYVDDYSMSPFIQWAIACDIHCPI